MESSQWCMKSKKTSSPIDMSLAESYSWGQNCMGWHFLNTEELSIIKEVMPSGGCEVLHYHKNVTQFFYILGGIATFELEETTHLLAAGQGIEVKPMQSHCISNQSSEELSILVISSPHSHSDRINIKPL